jgi:hypothetical protein
MLLEAHFLSPQFDDQPDPCHQENKVERISGKSRRLFFAYTGGRASAQLILGRTGILDCFEKAMWY